MNKLCIIGILLLSSGYLFAQDVSLNHSNTLYDSFENPVQTAFTKELSRKYAINLFLPTFYTQLRFKGDAEGRFKGFLFKETSVAKGLTGNTSNNIRGSANIYLLMLKLYKTVEYNREAGFSVQFKDEGNGNIPNGTFAFLNTYKNFNEGSYSGIFNINGFNQSYWQFGLTYRENYNPKWAFGAKLSFLSGATLTKVNIDSSALNIYPDNSFSTALKGNLISSYAAGNYSIKELLPHLANPGAAISLGASHTFKNKIYVTAHLKDLGFIKWGKKTYDYAINNEVGVINANLTDSKQRFSDSLNTALNRNFIQNKYLTFTNSSLSIAASKTFNAYKPVFIYTENLIHNERQFALVNNLQKRALNINLSGIYSSLDGFNIGSSFMIKSPNAEWYLGSERLLPAYYLTKGYIKKDPTIGKSPTQLSFYFGLSVKFGSKMQSMGSADFVDGLNDAETGFFSRLSKKEKRNLRKPKPAKTKGGMKRKN